MTTPVPPVFDRNARVGAGFTLLAASGFAAVSILTSIAMRYDVSLSTVLTWRYVLSAVVLVATIRALKYHGGIDVKELGKPNLAALEKGITNIERHVNNIRNNFGLPCVVAINHRTEDTDAEVKLLMDKLAHHGANHEREVMRAPEIAWSLRSSPNCPWAFGQPSYLTFPRLVKPATVISSPCHQRHEACALANAFSYGSRSGSWQKARSLVAPCASALRAPAENE